MAGKPRNTHPAVTAQKIAELSALARAIDRDEAQEIKAAGRAILLRHQTVRKLITSLKEARMARHLTLTETGEQSGIGKANLSRLENDPTPNPTLDTLLRYAEAVGIQLHIHLGA